MLRNIFALFLIIFFSANTLAVEKEELGKCAAKKTGAERLICYDNIAKTLGVDKPQTVVTVGKGKWIVRTDKSPINDTTNVYLSLSSEQSVRSGYDTVTPTLIIRCAEGKTNAYITWDLYLGLESTSMLTRLDKGPAVTKTWSISTDNKAVFVSGSDMAFAKQLMSHQTLLAQITPYSQSPVMATFDIGGLSEAIKPLREACKW
ncbi:MAG TPA: type VI secretion system-associated protein TagO [Gemmatimonadaceae bacterium]|nr:type VI secretion system-associated protein TagO [Gemmatimonadaceae bacterium]